MGTITLKQVDEVTNRVFTFMSVDKDGRNIFMDLGDGDAFALKRKLLLGLSVPADTSAGRLRLTTSIVVPKLNTATGVIEFGTANANYHIPVSWDLDDRKELEVLNSYLGVNSSMRGFLKDINLPE